MNKLFILDNNKDIVPIYNKLKFNNIKWKQKNQYYAYAYILFLTAMTASVIDSALWGFTVDYLNFYHLFCHDLKDLYVDTAVGFLLLGMREDRKCE